jgi:ABC-type sugar transport system substrate-binding protein
MKLLFKKTILFALVAALAVASLPLISASAAGEYDPPTTDPTGQVTNEKLEQVWARQLQRYERLGHADAFIEKAQKLIDRAKANGKDVTALQAALDAFAGKVKEAHPVYESMKGIINSHQGFDENGKVTDPEKAKETVKAMHDKFQEIKTIMDGTGEALREAIKAFREANPRPQPTATS